MVVTYREQSDVVRGTLKLFSSSILLDELLKLLSKRYDYMYLRIGSNPHDISETK